MCLGLWLRLWDAFLELRATADVQARRAGGNKLQTQPNLAWTPNHLPFRGSLLWFIEIHLKMVRLLGARLRGLLRAHESAKLAHCASDSKITSTMQNAFNYCNKVISNQPYSIKCKVSACIRIFVHTSPIKPFRGGGICTFLLQVEIQIAKVPISSSRGGFVGSFTGLFQLF